MNRTPIFAASAALLILAGCGGDRTPAGPLETEPVSVGLDSSEMVRATLKIGAGHLELRGGSAQLLDGTIAYNRPDWKPVVRYDKSSFRGVLTVDQPHKHGSVGHMRNEWNLRFNDEKPLDLSIEIGAGESQLELGSLNLRGLSVELGAGKIDLDLRGNPTHSYDAHVQGGVGEATVRVPSSIGVLAEAHGGLGQIEVNGLQKDGDHWVNEAWPDAKVRIRLKVEGGIGHIHIIGS